jgi:hypothetical protein
MAGRGCAEECSGTSERTMPGPCVLPPAGRDCLTAEDLVPDDRSASRAGPPGAVAPARPLSEKGTMARP